MFNSNQLFWLSAVLLICLLASTGVADDFKENVIIVHVDQSVDREFISDIVSDLGVITDIDYLFGDSAGGDWYRIECENLKDPPAAARNLQNQPGIQHAEPDYTINGALRPHDPFYRDGYQWYLGNPSSLFWPAGSMSINAEPAWDVTTGNHSVIIGIVDTGIDRTHVDLEANIWTNSGELPSDGIDNDVNGYVDDFFGWDFVSTDPDPSDDNGHGTLVAGIAASSGNNGIGGAGIAWNCRVMTIKVLDQNLIGSVSSGAAGIVYAAENGAQIINCSWVTTHSYLLDAAIETASSFGTVIVGATGNDAKAVIKYPAAHPRVIAVGATDFTGTFSAFSNYGNEIDLCAPGRSIYQAAFSDHGSRFPYAGASGTSMACAQVSGATALLWSLHLTEPAIWTSDFIRSHLVHSATYPVMLPDGRSTGLLDCYQALTLPTLPDILISDPIFHLIIDADQDGYFGPADLQDIMFEVTNDWGTANQLTVTILNLGSPVAILPGSMDIGALSFGETHVLSFQILAETQAVYGQTYDLMIQIQDSSMGYVKSFPITLPIGPLTVSPIITNAVWGIHGSIPAVKYRVPESVRAFVPFFSQLTIEPGVEVLFETGSSLHIDGELRAIGQPGQEIAFRSLDGNPWQGIVFGPDSSPAIFDFPPPAGHYLSGSVLRYCEISGANLGIIATGDSMGGGSPYLSRCRIENNSTGVELSRFNNTWINEVTLLDNQQSIHFINNQWTSEGQPLLSNSNAVSRLGATNTIFADAQSEDSVISPILMGNNIFGALPGEGFDFRTNILFSQVPILNAAGNYWGNYTTSQLESGILNLDLIYDQNDDDSLSLVQIGAWLPTFSPSSPGLVSDVWVTPPDSSSMGRMDVMITFSRELLQPPIVSFGSIYPFDHNLVTPDGVTQNQWFGHVEFDERFAGLEGVQFFNISHARDNLGMEIPTDYQHSFVISNPIQGVHGLVAVGKINKIDITWTDEETRHRTNYTGHIIRWGLSSGNYTQYKVVPSPANTTNLTVDQGEIEADRTYFIGLQYYEHSSPDQTPPFDYMSDVYMEAVSSTLTESAAIPTLSTTGLIVVIGFISLLLLKKQ